LHICGSLPGPKVALALIEISPTLLQSPLQGLSCLLPAGTSPLPPPVLSFSHRYLSWLAPPVTPHPRAELKEPAAVASTRTSICNSPLATPEAVWKGWVFVASNEAGNERHTAQHIADRADVKAGLVAAACTVIQHWNPVALHYRVWCYVDWLKGAEIDQGQLQVTVLFAALSSRAYCAIKEQLWTGIPDQAVTTDVHVILWVKIFRLVGIVWKWSNQTDTILL